MIFRSSIVAMSLIIATSASAVESLSCRNQDIEVGCSDGKCDASDSFTPSSLGLDIAKRELTICMYSMCLDGKIDKILVNKTYIIARSDNLISNNDKNRHGNAVVAINITNKAGVMLAEGFVNPVTCELK